ncbi:MAG: hypothetical protein JXK04_06150, partial [Campylobacterales bacterium]|nr:hypothetical protein [Campylobacterales bacterium]
MNTTKTVSIVFYRGEGTLAEKLIRLWTQSPYSHCEFGRSDGLYHSNDRFRFVSRTQRIELDPEEWEMCEISLPCEILERVERRQLRKNGTGYDWMGILFSQVFRLGLHSPKRWFCSKSNADDLLYAYRLMKRHGAGRYDAFLEVLEPISCCRPCDLSPRDLFRIMRRMECIQGRWCAREGG